MKSPKFRWPSLADCLDSIGKRPSMWLGKLGDSADDCRSLHLLTAFITGFRHGQNNPDDPLDFEYFTPWVAVHYGVNDGPMNGFSLIREHVGNDEKKAWDEFFRLLPNYIRDLRKIGPEGISKRKVKLNKRLFPDRAALLKKAKQKLGRRKNR